MRITSQRRAGTAALAVAALTGAALISGCGNSDKSSNPTKLAMSIAEKGKKASLTAPKSAKGGLVELNFKNKGKAPHGVQLIQYTGKHTVADVLKTVSSNSNKTPAWLKAQGGTAGVLGGQSASATLNLPAGNYVAVDSAALGPGGAGPPAMATLKLKAGSTGDLPSTSATVSANKTGKDKYAWDISGLKSGKNQITFNSKGKDAIHLILAAPVKGKAPPLSRIKKDLSTNGPPPSYVDFPHIQSSAVLDGGSSQTTNFDLKKPGQYVFFCPLTDRDGGKTHDQEGLLKIETIK